MPDEHLNSWYGAEVSVNAFREVMHELLGTADSLSGKSSTRSRSLKYTFRYLAVEAACICPKVLLGAYISIHLKRSRISVDPSRLAKLPSETL